MRAASRKRLAAGLEVYLVSLNRLLLQRKKKKLNEYELQHFKLNLNLSLNFRNDSRNTTDSSSKKLIQMLFLSD